MWIRPFYVSCFLPNDLDLRFVCESLNDKSVCDGVHIKTLSKELL